MFGSMLILRRRFTPSEWLAASMLVSGIALFSVANRAAAPPRPAAADRDPHADFDSLMGGSCVLVALLCDALLGNLQQRVLQGGTSVEALMLFQSAFGSVAMFAVSGARDASTSVGYIYY